MSDRHVQLSDSDLDPVENVHDLEPDGNVGASRKAHEQQRILNPNSVGHFESEGGGGGGLGEPLRLGSEIKKDGGPVIGEYQAGYNAYSMPLRSTLRAMGRVKDVSMTGAPMTPAELLARPELAARFRKLSLDHGSGEEDRAYDSWSAQQTKMKTDIQRFGAGQFELNASVSEYRGVQKLLQERRKEAEKNAKTSELHELTETAETLARVVEVSVEAWSAMGEIEEIIDHHVAFDEHAEGVGNEAVPSSNETNMPFGTVDDPTAVNQPTKSKTQKAGDWIDQMSTSNAMGKRIASQARAQLSKAGTFQLSLKDVFLLASDDGGAKYTRLQKDIVSLNKQIEDLKLGQQSDVIRTASERLTGFKLEFVARRTEVRADRTASRRGSRDFAKSMNAGAAGIETMYAAEAYQELAAFGELAAQQRAQMVDPYWGPVHRYVHGYDKHRFLAIGAADDAQALATNLDAVRDQRDYVGGHLPEWKKVAQQWDDFLGSRTNSALVVGDTADDKKTKAP